MFAADLYDGYKLGDIPPYILDMTKSWDRFHVRYDSEKVVMERIRKARSAVLRDPEYDMSTEIRIYPLHARGFYPVRFITEHQSLVDIWDALPEVEEYCYYNNSDRPDNVSSRQWDRRKEVWSRCSDDFSAAVSASLQYAIDDTMFLGVGLNCIYTDQPDEKYHQDRVRRLAESRLFKKNPWKKKISEAKRKAEKSNSTYSIVGVFMDFRDWLSKKGSEELIKEIDSINKSGIIEELTYATFNTTLDLKQYRGSHQNAGKDS